MKPIKIGIVGAGNVGRVLGVILSSKGYNVEAVTGRSPHNIQVDNYVEYRIAGDFGDKSYLVRVLDDVGQLSKGLDIIFVCTKIDDGLKILPKLASKLSPRGTIVTIQNMFWLDQVSKLISTKNCVFAYLDFSCETYKRCTYVKNFDGIKLGIFNKDAFEKMQAVRDVLSNICKVEICRDIMGFLAGRNIINTAISLLGAVSGLGLKGILDDRNGRYLFKKVMQEELKTFNHFGIKVRPYDDKLDYYQFFEKSIKGTIYSYKIIRLLVKNNGKVHSSALRELERNKKPELCNVLESLIRTTRHHNVSIPYIEKLYQFLDEIINHKRSVYENIFYDSELVNIKEKHL